MGKAQRFYINVWHTCNLNCRLCFNEGGKVRSRVLSYVEIERIIEEAREYMGIEEVQLTGGEPTQRPDIFNIIRSLQQKGLKVILQTNGFFNRSIVDEILRLQEDNFSLIISLDGIETNDYFRGRGATQKTIDNLRILSKKFQIRINTLLSSKIGWGEIERLALLAEEMGLFLAFNPVCPSGRAKPSFMMKPKKYFKWMFLLENLRQRGIRIRKGFDIKNGYLIETEECPVRKGTAIHVAADGSIYPCGFLVNVPTCFVGSARDLSLIDLRKKIPLYCRALSSACRKCQFYAEGYCHGGCPARIYALYKKFDEVDIYCMAKYFEESKAQ